ncbi:hypothetical protein BDV93DRAFT_468293 [Ceratobasidium sp. AG-I]|nr:hypothetical protein BDV93DRAFT_468293 [Ceratobasidium sp. AG-I]
MVHPSGSINADPKPFHGAWEGETKIILGIDIGTTQSGVAYAFLQKGVSQTIHRVTKWPGQEFNEQQSKIPTIVWYDNNNTAISFGAEATTHEAQVAAEDGSWHMARYFKLHLHPDEIKVKNSLKLDALPPGVSLQQVYSDFLRYLLQHTKSAFEDHILDGKKTWRTHGPTMEVIIAHPNGWGVREQCFLRTAAVQAGLADVATARTRVRFVTEAEASVHFCIYHTNLGSCLQPGTGFAVCDAGGSTVDTTAYRVTATRPSLRIEEIRASACIQAGAIFVDAAVEDYFRKTFTEAGLNKEDVEDYVTRGVKDFESVAKKAFRDIFLDHSIEIATSRDNRPDMRIRRGRITLPGTTVKTFFNQAVGEIMASVDQQTTDSNVSYILLVGGFGESPFLRQELKNQFEPRGCEIVITNDATSKAVADGALIWSTVGSVTGRASRFSYGIEICVRYDSRSSEHRGRKIYTCDSGHRVVHGQWGLVIDKGIVLDSEEVCKQPFEQKYPVPDPDLENFEIPLFSYNGGKSELWLKNKQDGILSDFSVVCTITADLTNLSGVLKAEVGVRGRKYWCLQFDVCIRFGDTELLAYLEWKEGGTTHTGPATIVADGLT